MLAVERCLEQFREQFYYADSGHPAAFKRGGKAMSIQSNVDVVKAAYSAFGAGEVQKLLALMTSDIVWEFPASKVIPWAGKFTGPAEVGRFFAALMEHSEPQAFEPLNFVASEDRVVALGRERFRVKSTGRTWACEWAHAFIFRDGKIAGFREYTDTAAMESAFARG
jgi:ketosteroid isomerase-like protein